MNSLNFARVLRVIGVLGLLFLLGDLQHATDKNIEILFATEIVLLAVVILTTKIIEICKSEQSNKPSGY